MRTLSILFGFIMACDCYKILAIFPSTGRSHHIFFSSLIQELTKRNHDVTLVNYHPVKNLPTLYRINLPYIKNHRIQVDMEKTIKLLPYGDLMKTYDKLQAYRIMANSHCKILIENEEVRSLVNSSVQYDLVILEQFVTDCGLAIAYKLNAPAVGMTAHILLPWTYSRLGASSNPAFVPNYFFSSGSKPKLLTRIKSALIGFAANMYYRFVIQRNDQMIINEIYPDTPDLEALGRNMSLIMLNQYFPLTGSRLYGANVVEVGGMHINESAQEMPTDLQQFLDTADSGAVYISFGTVARNVPRKIFAEIMKLIEKTDMKFVWKMIVTDWVAPKNVFMAEWLPQQTILCHPNVKAFISHSGMLSTSEAMHCGVPIVGIPLFGDQFPNSMSAVENGLGLTVDLMKLNDRVLAKSLKSVLQERFQHRAKELSRIWKDRPQSPMDTAVFWVEYVARHRGAVNMRPPTVDLPLYQYLMIDIILVIGSAVAIIFFMLVKVLLYVKNVFRNVQNVTKKLKND